MAERTIPIKIDFYRVSMGMNAPKDFGALAEQIQNSPEDDSRTLLIGSSHIRVHECEDKGEFWFANATKIKMDEVVVKAKLSGCREPIDFEEDEGIGYDAAISYRKDRNILMLQRNRNVLTAETLALYIEKHTNCFPINFDLILQPDALASLASQQYYKTIEIKVARPNSGLFLSSLGTTPEHIESIMQELDAPELELRLTVGRKKKGRALSSEAVKNLVDKLLSRRPSIESLAVNGIELVDGILSYTEKLRADSPEGLSNELRWQVMNRAWHACAKEIVTMYRETPSR